MSKTDLRIDWATHAAAKYACEHWHYSKSVPVPPLVKVGVWEKNRFVGVVIFSRGANNNLLKPYGLNQKQGCELTRAALSNHSAPVSRIIRLAMKFLHKQNASLRIIVSFADPNEGHYGGIYQAGNWIYTGLTASTCEYVGPDGKRWHSRMVKTSGWTNVQGKLRKVLTPTQCKKIEKLGKHRYLMPLDEEMRDIIAPLAKPYPKRPKQAMTGDHPEQRRCDTDRDAPNSAGADGSNR